MAKETLAYTVSVEFYDETLPQRDGKTDTNGIEYVMFAKSFADVEERVKSEVGDKLVKIYGIETMDATPLF